MQAIDELCIALRKVLHELRGIKEPWLVGGSCGLLLQGVPLGSPPRDLDLYADMGGAKEIHKALSAYSIDRQIEDQSDIYKSVLSHYLINGIKVELVGGFEVTAAGSFYKVEAALLYLELAAIIEIPLSIANEDNNTFTEHASLRLMPLEHELLFNILRNRPDRFEAIAMVMRSRYDGISAALAELIRRNRLSGTVTAQLERLFGNFGNMDRH